MADSRIDYLLIGGGRTSANAAQAIRENDPNGSIAIVAAENRKPYDRPPLSKNFLEGMPPNPDDVEAKPDDFFDKHQVELLRGIAADSMDRENKLVTLSDRRRYEYGKLLIATGATPIELKIPGTDRDNVFYLRTVDDSMKIRDAAKSHHRIVCIGAGFVGSEVSASLQGIGKQCTVIGREDRMWEKFLSKRSGEWLASYFESKGVRVVMGATTTEITDKGVKLASGEEIEADIVVVGIGVHLNLGLATDAGLDVDRQGVVTDASLRTSDPSIWAAGDVADYQDVNFGKRWHLEHYMNADWQGSHVGKNMATGAADPFTNVPYFFSDMFDIHFLLRGDPQEGESAKVLGDPQSAEFIELYAYPDGRLSRGIVFTRDDKKQDQIGDKIEEYLLAKRNVDDLNEASF